MLIQVSHMNVRSVVFGLGRFPMTLRAPSRLRNAPSTRFYSLVINSARTVPVLSGFGTAAVHSFTILFRFTAIPVNNA